MAQLWESNGKSGPTIGNRYIEAGEARKCIEECAGGISVRVANCYATRCAKLDACKARVVSVLV